MRRKGHFLFAAILFAGCGGQLGEDDDGRTPRNPELQGCLDEDDDGYGVNCPLGPDCYDYDPDVNIVCPTTWGTWGESEPPDGGADDGGAACITGAARPCLTRCGSVSTATCDAQQRWGDCAPAKEETSCSDGQDDDCDGRIDQADSDCDGICVAATQRACPTACGSVGVETCDGASRWGACAAPKAETSCGDAQDDDCDGQIDRADPDCAAVCVLGAVRSCTTTCGSTGVSRCGGEGRWTDCAPRTIEEGCTNGVDDDCDGLADLLDSDCGAVCTVGALRSCMSSCGSAGASQCDGNGQWSACKAPGKETDCTNKMDDDCDGKADGDDADCGAACSIGATKSCAASCGAAGTSTCEGMGQWSACKAPGAETRCDDKIDDDCDGKTDKDDGDCAEVCLAGAVRACTTTCGSAGVGTCDMAGRWGACQPPTKESRCSDKIDDDCDGKTDLVDEDCKVCTSEKKKSCTTTCGSAGESTCTADGQWGACQPPSTETSCTNGIDDDCNGLIDSKDAPCAPPPECKPDQVDPCIAPCGAPGTKRCTADQKWGPCQPPSVEISCTNGVDDNCNGKKDKDDPDCGCKGPDCCTVGSYKDCKTSCGSDGRAHCVEEHWGPCSPPKHEGICNDKIDNDCDGKTDTADKADCEMIDCNIGPCNDDWVGAGDRCSSSQNTNKCSSGHFKAWCHRRDPKYPTIWNEFLAAWVDAHCNGKVVYVDPKGNGKGDYYTCTDKGTNVTYICHTPLVLAFEPDRAVEYTPAANAFSLDPHYAGRRVDWPTSATPWLAMDRDDNGRIDGGSELFGSSTPVSYGGRAVNGFDALAELDSNRDGRISPADRDWPRLRLWRDADRDGVSTKAELSSLGQAGIEAIELAHRLGSWCDERGNCERERGRFHWRDAAGRPRIGAMIDVLPRLSP